MFGERMCNMAHGVMVSTVICLLLAIHGGWATLEPFSSAKAALEPFAQDFEECFCKLAGQIDDCTCDVDTVDYFNNMKIYPRLQSLLQKPFFRYFQYNDHRPCPFWDDTSGRCANPNCGVRSCAEEELPPALKGAKLEASGRNGGGGGGNHNRWTSHESAQSLPEEEFGEFCSDDSVDNTLSDQQKQDLALWAAHDRKETSFCQLDDADGACEECVFVDLTLNPERYTGYSGEASHRIWRAIYEENCFKPPSSNAGTSSASFSDAFLQDSLDGMCLEKRAFYRAVSGLHASITIHLTANHLLKKADSPFVSSSDRFGPNVEEFLRRFDPVLTNGQGPFWLKNLYFVYLLELRALTKAAPLLEAQSFYTGKEEEDKETLIAVKELLALARSFPDHFDESKLFSGSSAAAALKLEFREHFRNISRIMDCVGCDKCRLWGKLQVTGLGTALKILFSDDDDLALDPKMWADKLSQMSPPTPVDDESNLSLKLTRNEIVALFNAFGRISTSIQQLDKFRRGLS